MTSATATSLVDAPVSSTPSHGPLTLASFMGNRWPYSPAGRVDHSVRIAFVGDSMVYGQGVSFTQTLAPRVARHLNVARPGLWFDCQTIGLPGACAFHALARAESHAAPLAPDVLVIALTRNDAYMLRGQPADPRLGGQTWVDFEPILATAFADFHARWQRMGGSSRVAVLYFDHVANFGEARPADILRPICERHGFVFVDGPEALAGLPAEQLVVSPHDGHLGSSAHDIVARHLARILVDKGWIPAAPDYDDVSWLGRCEAAGASLTAAGVPSAPAASEALSVLRLKWHDRRNRSRKSSDAEFQSVERRLLQSVRDEWKQVALKAFEHHLSQVPSIPNQISDVEDQVFRARTLNLALHHAAVTGRLQQPTAGLLAESVAPAVVDNVEVVAMAERANARSVRALDMLEALRDYADRLDALGLRPLAALAERSRLANTAAALGLTELARLMPSLPDDRSVSDVVAAAAQLWRIADEALGDADLRTGWPHAAAQLERLTPDRPTMALHFSAIAGAGAQPWTYRLGAESRLHAVREGYLACGILVRDGRPHTYSVDLPLMLASMISFTINGDGVGQEASGLRVMPIRIEVPGLPEPLTFKTSRVTRRSDTELILEYCPSLLARPE